jgi:hypothetical protein
MRYSSAVRRQVCLRLRSGAPVAEIAADTSISLNPSASFIAIRCLNQV